MKLFRYLFAFTVAFMAVSCNSDDDVCVGGEATPRMKMKFKTTAGKLAVLDSLYVDVDYGEGKKNIIKEALADSVLIPLRVDDANYTDVFVRLKSAGSVSKFRVNYSTASTYVSPACGIKKTYENVNAQLLTPNPVSSIEQNQTKIENEDKTVIYLHF